MENAKTNIRFANNLSVYFDYDPKTKKMLVEVNQDNEVLKGSVTVKNETNKKGDK